jgi:serine/threonine-protein kinase
LAVFISSSDLRVVTEKRHPSADPSAGDVIDFRFEILGELGRGAGGAVYRAHDRLLDERVALKLLQAPGGDPVWTSARFRAEVKLARRVAHANVCRIFEYGEHGRRPFFTMELIEGATVKQRLARGAYPAEAALGVAVQVAEALHAIHAAGIVHRDLKPQNLIETSSGAVKVTDFGIATAGPASDAGVRDYVVGTPEYMSPEQLRGREVDARSDLYALGIVLFEMIAGRLPAAGADPAQTTHVPAAVVPVLRRALAARPEDRYPDAPAMAAALREARQALARTQPSHGTTLTQRRPRGRRRRAARVLVASSILGLTLAVAWVQGRAVPPDAGHGWLQLGIRPWAHVSVNGVSVGTTPLRRVALNSGIYTVRLDNPDYRPLMRKVHIRPGETTPLRIDLPLDAVRR